MRLTASARLSVNDDGTVTIVVKSFAATLDKRESAALWKSCGKPVENLLTEEIPKIVTREYPGESPVVPVPTVTPGTARVPRTGRTESNGQEDQKIAGFVLNGTTPNDMAVSIVLWVLEAAPNSQLTHDGLRDAAYELASDTIRNTDDLNEVLQRVWNVKFWKSRPELAVNETTVRLA